MRKNVEKQLLLDGQFCKPYPVAHVKFRRVQVPGWLNQGLSMSTFVRTREMVVNYAREGRLVHSEVSLRIAGVEQFYLVKRMICFL